MTESQSGSAPDALLADHAEGSDLPSTGAEPAAALPAATFASSAHIENPVSSGKKYPSAWVTSAPTSEQPRPGVPDPADVGRGSRRRSQWLSAPAGGSGGGSDPGPSGPGRVQKKTALVLGGTAVLVIVVAAVVAATALSGGRPARIATVASSSSALPAVPDSGTLVPISVSASASRAAKKAAGKHSASPAAAASRAPAETVPEFEPSSASPRTSASARSSSAAGTSSGVAQPEPVSYWTLNDDDSAEVAADVMGKHAANGASIVWCPTGNGNCATFNGTSSDFTTPGPVLDTAPGSSFTVSANVYMTGTNAADAGFETILSQDGTYDSGFYLQYSGTDDRWAFARVPGDVVDGPAGIRALSTSAPQYAVWTHLVGVFDASDNQLRLYVNGVLEGTATDPTPFAAAGDFAIGRGQSNGVDTDWFNGAAVQIKVYDQALTTAQVDNI
jgi:Concanavalin A-like lectin/glucanases superfamily